MDEQIEITVSPAVAAGRAKGGRARQEDDLVCLHDETEQAYLLVLADGMGGHGAGELASRGVIETARRMWMEGSWRRRSGALFLEGLCQEAHQQLLMHRDAATGIEPHSTVVSLLIKGDIAYWAHVGDSRLYRFQGRRFLGHTRDHSVAQQKSQRGQRAASASGDDQQHLLLRGLGGAQAPKVEHGYMPARADHSFALCSDGVWAHLSTPELHAYARHPESEQALREALSLVLQRGGEEGDNASLIFVRPGSIFASPRRGIQQWLAMLGRRR